MQFKILNKFLNKQTISKVYKNLINIFLSSNINYLFLYQDKNYPIKLKLTKSFLFYLFYNLFKY